MQHNSIEEFRQWAAENGIKFTEKELDAAATAMQNEAKRLAEIGYKSKREDRLSRFWDAFLSYYPSLLEGINNFGNVIITGLKQIIISVGVPVAFLLLTYVEQQRVYHGIQLFESDNVSAAFAAWSLVILNVVLEVVSHYIEHKAGWLNKQRQRWSLRIAVQDLRYRAGFGEWSAIEQSPAYRFNSLLRLVTFTILALATAGSMRVVIESQQGRWYDSLYTILIASSLSEMSVWMGGLLFAVAAVLSAQALARYVAENAVETYEKMKIDALTASGGFDAEMQRAGITALTAIMAKKQGRTLPVSPVNQSVSQSVVSQLTDSTDRVVTNYNSSAMSKAAAEIVEFMNEVWLNNMSNNEVSGRITAAGTTVSRGTVNEIMKYVRTLRQHGYRDDMTAEELVSLNGTAVNLNAAQTALELVRGYHGSIRLQETT